MKYLLIIFLPVFSFSQKELALNLNFCQSGRTLDLIYQYKFKEKNKIGVGILYNIGNLTPIFESSNVFKKKLYPLELNERFGIHVNYNRYFPIKKLKVKFFLFIDNQVKYASVITNVFNPNSYSKSDVRVSDYDFTSLGKYLWIQNSLGFGIDIPLTEKISLSQKVGVGFENKIQIKSDVFLGGNPFFEFASLYNISLIYQFKQKEKSLQ